MRTYPGKSSALLLDMAGNVGRHGLPMSPDITALGGRVVPIPKRGVLVGLLNCPKCLCVYPSDSEACPECHAGKPHVPRVVRTVAGTLDEVIGVEATGAQTWAERATPEARMAWVRKKLSCGWSRARISAAYRSMFRSYPDWKRIAA